MGNCVRRMPGASSVTSSRAESCSSFGVRGWAIVECTMRMVATGCNREQILSRMWSPLDSTRLLGVAGRGMWPMHLRACVVDVNVTETERPRISLT